MEKKELRLSMQPDWRREIKLHQSNDYIEAMNSLDLDEHSSCYFCGAQDGPYLELHHLDGDHTNFDMDKNVVLACSMCHRYHHLGLLAYYKQATTLYLPHDLHISKLDLSIINRAALYHTFLNPDKHIGDLPIVRQLMTINEVFKRYDSLEIWNAKLKKSKELKEIRDKQQKEIRDLDNIKDEVERRTELERITEEHRLKNQEFEEKHNIKMRDRNRLIEVGKDLDRIKKGELLYLANDISLLSLVHALTQIHQTAPEKFDVALKHGLHNSYGQICVWFTKNIMQSLNGQYTADQKLHYLISRQARQLRNRRNIA